MAEALPITSVAKRLRLCLSDPVNEAVVRDSLRDVVTALEQRLDALRANGGLADSIVEKEPRLLNAVEALEASLSDVLTGFWELQKDNAPIDPSAVVRISGMVDRLDAVGEKESALLFESQVHLGGTD